MRRPQAPARRAAEGRGDRQRPRSWGFWAVVGAVAAVAVGSFGLLHYLSGRYNPNRSLARTVQVNRTPPEGAVGPAQAPQTVLAFWPTSASEPLGRAMANATGVPEGQLGRDASVAAAPGGYLVRFRIPVAVRRLKAEGELVPSGLPGGSNLKTGDLEVNAYDGKVYDLSMNPRTGRATFLFRLSRDGRHLWALNANALTVVGQSGSFNSL
jgi:hypothetical protein